jgi:cholesterol oxidase
LIDDVFFFNAMGEDDASGRFTLAGDELDLDWDHPIGDHPVFAKHEEVLRGLSKAMGGTYMPLPTWNGEFFFAKKTLIVTHPLGGCRIGQTMSEGVVNEFGQVYDESKKTTDPKAVHSGLYIVDGSVIPGALAANPTLTISAQALKVVEKAVGPLPNI